MATAEVFYKGQLRTKSTHLKSGNELITDAPVDNHGKGEAFSPTDTVASALASCMLTIMGIKANGLNVDLSGTKAEVIKVMSQDPRRISEIQIEITFVNNIQDHHKSIFENAALNCPVAKSLNRDLVQKVRFTYP